MPRERNFDPGHRIMGNFERRPAAIGKLQPFADTLQAETRFRPGGPNPLPES